MSEFRDQIIDQPDIDATRRSTIAENPYITYVTGRLLSSEPIVHEVKDWRAEMVRHARGSYPDASTELIEAALLECETRILGERSGRGAA